MRSTKLVLVAAFCLLLVGAGTAHAREWSVKGKALEELKVKSETTKGTLGASVISVPSLSLKIECASGQAEGFTVKTAGAAEGSLVLSSCKTSVKTCTVQPITLKVTGELSERNAAVFLVFKAQSGALGTIVITGAGCTLPKETSLTGNLAAEATAAEKVEQALTFSAASAEKAETHALFGAQSMTLEAKLNASLSGAHAGEAWGFFGEAAMEETGGGAAELNFTGMAAGSKKAITAKNVGWSLSNVKMESEWIEEGGVRTEAHFKIIAAPGAQPCAFPPGAPPFETLVGNGAKCDIGIEFVSGTAGRTAKYVLEYGPYIFWAGIVKFPIRS